MIRKWTIEKVTALFQTRGFTVLETEHPGSKSKWRYRCPCGNVDCSISIDSFNAGADNCKSCAKKKKEQTNIERFGVPYLLQSAEVKATMAAASAPERKRKREERDDKRDADRQAKSEAREARVAAVRDALGPEYAATVDRITKSLSVQPSAASAPVMFPSDRPRVDGAPRWPEPKPIRPDYPDLDDNQWRRIRSAWKNSTPHAIARRQHYMSTDAGKAARRRKENKAYKTERGRAKRARTHTSAAHLARMARYRMDPVLQARLREMCRVYAKTPQRRASMAAYSHLVNSTLHAFKMELSVDGHCAYTDPSTGMSSCPIPTRDCDVHHMHPTDLYPEDGKPRKQKALSHCSGLRSLQNEIKRNMDDKGVLLLQLLCPQHHGKVTFTDFYKGTQGPVLHRWLAIARMKTEINKCQYENCMIPDQCCETAQDTPLFHFDHLYTKNDANVPLDMAKVESIGIMIRQFHKYTMEQIIQEIRKCRLVHATCHRQITREQFAAGRIKRPHKQTSEFEQDESHIMTATEAGINDALDADDSDAFTDGDDHESDKSDVESFGDTTDSSDEDESKSTSPQSSDI